MRCEEAVAGGLILRAYLRAKQAGENEKSEIHIGHFTFHVGTVIWIPGYLRHKLPLNTSIGNWELCSYCDLDNRTGRTLAAITNPFGSSG
jgi:hypothetical protein